MFLNVITCRSSINKKDKNGVDLFDADSALPFCSVFDLGIQFENHYSTSSIYLMTSCFLISI